MIASKKRGRIIIPADTHPWPHELRVAGILARAGYVVEFIPEANIKTPDIYLDGVMYEIKSPRTNNPKKIIRNLKRALEKCQNVIIDTSRIKYTHDKSIERLLRGKARDLKTLKNLLLITKSGQIIAITASL